jgi:hypothetical protein
MLPLPLPLDAEPFVLVLKVGAVLFGAGATVLTWSCLALSARWSEMDETLGPPAARPARLLP